MIHINGIPPTKFGEPVILNDGRQDNGSFLGRWLLVSSAQGVEALWPNPVEQTLENIRKKHKIDKTE